MKQKVLLGISLCGLLALTGCVSEQSYVGSDKPVSDRTFDNIEAARTRISLGLNYLRRGDTSQAKYNLERARSFAPNSAEVHSALAYYYQTVGENKQAEEYFRIAISKDVDYADAYNNYGAFLCQLQRYDEAEQLLLKAVSRPGYIRVAESYENLALCKLQQNNFAKTSSYLDSSISHNSTRISSLTLAAGLAYAMGDNRLAKERIDRIQRLGRVSARTVLLSYLIADKSGDTETRRNAEQLLLTLYTDAPETRLLLQNRTQESEFEQLRERYKDSLMANIVMPDPAAAEQPVPAKPVANPKLKVVKRKTTDADAESDAAVASYSRPRTVPTNTASAVAASLAANTAAANAVAQQPDTPAVVSQPAGNSLDNAVNNTAKSASQNSPAKTAVTAAAAQPQPLPVEQVVVNEAVVEPEVVTAEKPATENRASVPGVAAEPPRAVPADTDADDVGTDVTDTDIATTAVAGTDVTNGDMAKVAATGIEAANITVANATITGSAADTPFHLVQAAESLYAISVQHNIRLQRLMEWNQLTPESVIKTGQKIWLGPVSAEQLASALPEVTERQPVQTDTPFHIVASGETMFAISYRYNIKLDKFMSWNNFTAQSTLQVGQRVYVVDPESIAQ